MAGTAKYSDQRHVELFDAFALAAPVTVDGVTAVAADMQTEVDKTAVEAVEAEVALVIAVAFVDKMAAAVEVHQLAIVLDTDSQEQRCHNLAD